MAVLTALLLAACASEDGVAPSEDDPSSLRGDASAPPDEPEDSGSEPGPKDASAGDAGSKSDASVTSDAGSDAGKDASVDAGPPPPPATHTDGMKNLDETDVDCGGGTGAARCVPGKSCLVDEDCSLQACNAEKRCAAGRTCKLAAGGTTCGAGETGTAGAQHEDCCTKIESATGPQGKFAVDKYMITAGRLRVFLDAIDGKVRDYVTSNPPPGWDPAWTKWLPNSWDGAGRPAGEHLNVWSTYAQVGGAVVHDDPTYSGCWLGNGQYDVGHPTYYIPNGLHTKNGVTVQGTSALYGDEYARWLTQAQLDERAANCVPWTVLTALCAYDGGQLISRPEYDFIVDVDGDGSNGISTFPWGTTPQAGSSRDGTAIRGPATFNPTTGNTIPPLCPSCVDDRVNWYFNYTYPATPAPTLAQPRPRNDQSNYISAPGRFPAGASRPLNANPGSRVQDIIGLMIEMTRTQTAGKTYTFTFGNADAGDDLKATLPGVIWRGGSWEGHGISVVWAGDRFTVISKYGKAGSRCVYY